MMQELKKYQVTILGESYTILSDESEQDINKAASLIDSMIKEASSKSTTVEQRKLAVFVALRLATKMVNMEDECDRVKHKEDALVRLIDSSL